MIIHLEAFLAKRGGCSVREEVPGPSWFDAIHQLSQKYAFDGDLVAPNGRIRRWINVKIIDGELHIEVAKVGGA